MTIQLEFDSELAEKLSLGAKAQGVGLEEYVTAKLRAAMNVDPQPTGALSNEQLLAMLAAMSEGAERLPRVATSTFSRESFYEERR